MAILLISESDDLKDLFDVFLAGMGQAVEWAGDEVSAVSALKNSRFDLIFLQCDSPDLPAGHIVEKVREYDLKTRPQNSPLIGLFDSSVSGQEEALFELGLSGFITTPVSKGALVDTVNLATESLPVDVIPEMKPLLEKFLSNRRADIERLEQALKASDYTTTRTIGHKMKGDSGSYGVDILTGVGKKIEEASVKGDRAMIIGGLVALRSILPRIKPEYKVRVAG